MRIKTIVDNYIFDVFKRNKYNQIYVYGSENLELEKLIFNFTSSPIIGGDVDFCNVLIGKYFSARQEEIILNEEILNDLKLTEVNNLENIDKLALSMIHKAYKPKRINEHNIRLFNNVIKNKDNLVCSLKKQFQTSLLKIEYFIKCDLFEFIKNIEIDSLLIIDNRTHNFISNNIQKVYVV